MRGEPVLPSKFVSLFDYPMEYNSTNDQLRKISQEYSQIEHHSGKLDENIRDLTKHLTQSITDVNELLNDSYKRFSPFEQIPTESNEIVKSLTQLTVDSQHSSDS